MASVMDSVTAAISSPLTQFAFGLGLFYGIQKFFKEVEDKLNQTTKVEIWFWLAGVHTADKVSTWPGNFSAAFESFFGKRHLTWHCFWRSSAASAIVAFAFYLFPSPALHFANWYQFAFFAVFIALFNALPDYFSLLKTRYVLRWMTRSQSTFLWFGAVLVDVWITLYIAAIPAAVIMLGDGPPGEWRAALSWRFWLLLPLIGLTETPQNRFIVFPALFTSAWVWLYACSGYILKAARLLDMGFAWMNRRFDIENKPLQSMGIVAGGLCALFYWTFAVLRSVGSR